MSTPGSPMPHLALGTLTALSAGALALSLVQSTPVAPRQLHLAAKDTVAASSFALTESIHQSGAAGGAAQASRSATLLYRGSDQLELRGGGQVQRVVGTQLYSSTDGGSTWTKVPGMANTANLVSQALGPLRLAEQVPGVTASAGQDHYLFTVPLSQVAVALGISNSTVAGNARVDATVSGEFLTGMTVSGGGVQLQISYAQIDAVPPIVAPPAAG